ncbi:MAG: dihydroneopterin aldolase [Phyllobacterium sp.]
MKPLVVKLGGSMAGHPDMQRWIDVLASAGFPVIIVPGGGPFAEQVRAAQEPMSYSDEAAHAMAILAMDQFGIAVAERNPHLRTARTRGHIETLLDEGFVAVWLPSSMTLGAPDIPCSWEVTSDSLSAWLARQLDADDLLLVKRTDAYRCCADLAHLAAAGIVDGMLPHMLGENTTLHLAGPAVLDGLDLPLASIPGHGIMRQEATETMDTQ